MQDPLVSVSIITYNHGLYIRKAIDCVLAQKTNFPFEVVIGEDCSTDGTREIVFDYAKRFPDIIRVITSEQNVGMKENYCRTNQACRGKYIAFCDGDDYWHNKDKLQLQTDFLESHTDYGLVYSDHDRYFVKNGKKIKRFYYATKNVPPKKLNVFKGWGPGLNLLTCTVMARRHLLHSIISDPYIYQSSHYIGGVDIAFSEIALVSKIHYIDKSLSTYTVQIESASNTRNICEKLRFSISVYDGYLHIAEKYGHNEEIPDLKARKDEAYLWLAFWERNIELAKKMKIKSAAFSFKARVLYYGIVNSFLYYSLYIFVFTYRKIRTFITECLLFYV